MCFHQLFSAVEESYQTPNRIYIKTNNKRFLISDYVFPDETSSDIIERIRELFSYEIEDPETQIIHVEKFPREFLAPNVLTESPSIQLCGFKFFS